jgi:hypothetical protein
MSWAFVLPSSRDPVRYSLSRGAGVAFVTFAYSRVKFPKVVGQNQGVSASLHLQGVRRCYVLELQAQITAYLSSQPLCLEWTCFYMEFDGLTEAFHNYLPCNEFTRRPTSLMQISDIHKPSVCGNITRVTVLQMTEFITGSKLQGQRQESKEDALPALKGHWPKETACSCVLCYSACSW